MSMIRTASLLFALALVLAVSAGAAPVGTAFTYQGRLEDAGTPANGIYDLEFALYDAATAGTQVGTTVTKDDVAVANGLFVVALDFGSAAFTGEARWLEIGVRPGSSTDPFTTLGARQELTPTPNAIYSGNAGVSSDVTCVGCVSESELGFDPATQSELSIHGTSGDHDARYVLKAGDTMTGTLTLNPAAGVGLSTTADINLEGRVMRGTTPFIHANTSLHNTAIGENALIANTTGYWNTATGFQALYSNIEGYSNTAVGNTALFANTTGDYNTATGTNALHYNTTGSSNTAMGYSALAYNTTGYHNAAMGTSALYYNTTGYINTAMGSLALFANTTGYYNTAIGVEALYANTAGNANTAMGLKALFANTTGNANTAMGRSTLNSNTIGYNNTAVGRNALYNTTGNNNTALGNYAGYEATTGDFNIYISNQGIAAEGNTIRIGDSNQTRFFAAGIHGVTTDLSDAIPVLIDSAGQLGTTSSSLRFKEDVRDMSDTSAALFQLRPVTFRYKGRPHVLAERHYGLIAEEVNGVIPELVARSADGRIESVKYHELPAMLLNELQKQQRMLQAYEEQLRSQDEEIRELRAFKDVVLTRLAQLECR